ncbi:DUF4097 family beta strand repeat-containing protein [Streptomyces niveus]|uniref:DUF4097 domain-containing protein n=1 Tax=Streptomyces niveus TaxID=193462 RepID=A0A1U9QYZ2_STRNV|nr:hypothetical protein BBN63_24600 [Streptomyces niveus]
MDTRRTQHTRRSRRARTLVAAGGAVLAVVAVSGCGSADADEAPTEKRSFAFSGKTLTISSANSSIDLVPADVEDVEVTRQVDGWVLLGSGPDPVWKLEDDTLTLEVKCKALVNNCESRHRVKVPRGTAVKVVNDNGRVSADGFDTALNLRSDNGSVDVRNSSGTLDLFSDNGKVTTEGVSSKSVHARSDNGAVRLRLTSVPDKVDTFSDNGSVTIDLPKSGTSYAVTAKSDNGSVDVDVPTDDDSAHVVKAHSDNGKVTVRSAN